MFTRFTLALGLMANDAALAASVCTTPVNAGYDVSAVSSLATSNAKNNWEWGTQAEALLELDSPDVSVFSDTAFPDGKIPKVQTAGTTYAKEHITLGADTLTPAGVAAGDPASLGVSAVLLGQSDSAYLTAAGRQVNTLLTKTPRYSNGAISHRNDGVMLWSDFISQVPPAFAYYGVATNNASLVQQAVTQITLYRQVLQDPSTGLWKHIAGARTDSGTWSTGNGWAVYGIARVLATIAHWTTSPTNLSSQQALLTQYAGEIFDGAIAADPGTQLLRNYITEASTFREASGTALIAAAIYRLAVLAPTKYGTAKYLDWADSKRAAVAAAVGSGGVLAPVIDPYAYTQTSPYKGVSPEGQSFAVYLYSAYRDCVCAGICKSA